MEATAPDHTNEPASAPRRYRLEAAPTPEHDAVPEQPSDPPVGRPATLGAIVGFVAMAVVAAIGSALAGLEAAPAIGLGIFVGLWGGLGFGFMMGATVPFARHLDAMSAHGRRAAAQPSGDR